MTFASMQISVQVALSHPLNNLQRVFMTNLEILETTGLFGIKYKIPFVLPCILNGYTEVKGALAKKALMIWSGFESNPRLQERRKENLERSLTI